MPTPTPLPYKAASAARPDDPVERRGMERWAFRLRHGESRCLVWPLFHVERLPQCSLLLVVQWTQLSAQSTRAVTGKQLSDVGIAWRLWSYDTCVQSMQTVVRPVDTPTRRKTCRHTRHVLTPTRHKTCTEVRRRRKLHTLAGKACGVVSRH